MSSFFFQVSWVHIPRAGLTAPENNHEPTSNKKKLDLLTIGNSTYTLDPRVEARFAHPSNWGLRIRDLRPSDAGQYLCQISTFPVESVRVVNLEIVGE